MSFLGDVVNIGTGGISDAVGLTNNNPPPPPDVAARDAASLEAARQTARLNNPNITNQYGSQTYTQNPDGSSSINQTLSPEQQALFDSQQRNQQTASDMYGGGMLRMGDTLGSKFDISSAPAAPGSAEGTRDKVINAMMGRSDQRLGQANENQDAQLIASGITPGTEAWKRAKAEQGQNRNDAMSQAEIAGGNAAVQSHGMDTANRRNSIAELLQQRQLPMNELNAFKNGAQQNPFAGQGFQGGSTVRDNGGLLDQYNMDIYNQDMAGRNALIGGVATLGGAAIRGGR